MEHDPTARSAPARRMLGAAACVLGLASLLAGCGSDEAAAPTTTATSAEVAATEPGSEPVPALCEAWLEVDRAGSALGDPDAAPEDAQAATQAIADALASVDAPDGLGDQLATAQDAVDAALDGDPSAFEAPSFTEAVTELGAWVHDGCGFGQVEVSTVEHAFEGLDAPLAAGATSFHLVNAGAEAHVLVLHRFVDGSDATAEDLFGAAQEQGALLEEETEPVVTGAFAAPGAEAYLTADLEPGRYVAFCPIPSGFTGDGPPPADAPPHLALGMYAELTVS